jgi:biopolymer transport protein ExbB
LHHAAAREMAALRCGVRPLSVVGTIAPLVGLLGTVLGMIVAFRTASQAGLGKGELMAQGIYMALLTTAAGLTIAIPALLLAALFNARIEKYFREIDEHLMRTMPCFARMEEKVEDRG